MVVEAADPNAGFDWADAAIGASVAVAICAICLGAAMVLPRPPPVALARDLLTLPTSDAYPAAPEIPRGPPWCSGRIEPAAQPARNGPFASSSGGR